jgi:hypothetical protein
MVVDDTAMIDTPAGDSEAWGGLDKKDLECEEGFRVILDSIRSEMVSSGSMNPGVSS